MKDRTDGNVPDASRAAGPKHFVASAVWLRRLGDTVEALVEIDGVWRVAASAHYDGPFSHIAEGRGSSGSSGWPVDPVTSHPALGGA